MKKLTDEEINVLLAKFDRTSPVLQRQIIAKFVADRTVLLEACGKAMDMLRVSHPRAHRVLGDALTEVLDGEG